MGRWTACGKERLTQVLQYPLLAGEGRYRFEAHLRGCPMCRGTIDALARVEVRIRELAPALVAAHPEAEKIYDFALVPGNWPIPKQRARVVRAHVARCSLCSREVDRIRAIDSREGPLAEVLSRRFVPARARRRSPRRGGRPG